MQTHLGIICVSCDECCFSLPGIGEGDILKNGNLCSAFRQERGEQRVFLTSVASQLPSAQNNPYAKVAHLRVAYSDPFNLPLPLDVIR